MNQIVKKFERCLAKLHEEKPDSGWLREAIEEIRRLENLLLEERMKVEAYEVALNRKNSPVEGKRKANEKRLKELFKSMKL